VDEADMEAEVAKKTQEIQSYRAEVNELEAKLFHDEEARPHAGEACMSRADTRASRCCRSKSTNSASSRAS
jgi:hypothetical protein